MDRDVALRLALFGWLEERSAFRENAVFLWSELNGGFRFEGEVVHLIGAHGIWKPRQAELPLSIATAPPGNRPPPYDDRPAGDGTLLYRYRGTDPLHRDNVGLRELGRLRRFLVYFHGIVKGEYVASWPAFVVGEEPAALAFRVQLDDAAMLDPLEGVVPATRDSEDRRAYVTVTALRRLHQEGFRRRVLRAYLSRCTICRLRHESLLDAAHILEDRNERGQPVVPNGLALCKIHHAAFDRHILGVTPDGLVELRREVLDEIDGPMLRHGLQAVHGTRLHLPRRVADRPDRERLAERYELFRRAL